MSVGGGSGPRHTSTRGVNASARRRRDAERRTLQQRQEEDTVYTAQFHIDPETEQMFDKAETSAHEGKAKAAEEQEVGPQ